MSLWYWAVDPATKEKYQALVPLTDVVIKGVMNGSLTTLDVQLSYVNNDSESPIECTFEFPLTEKSAVTRLAAQIGDRIVEASIRAKEEAKERYDDAIASGHTAFMAEKSEKKKNSMTLKLGNLLPGQQAVINISITEEVEVVGGAYCYSLPAALFPDYKKHDVRNKEQVESLQSTYAINYEFRIASSQRITYLSVPKGVASEFNQDRTQATVRGNKTARSLKFFYRTAQMLRPQLLFEESA